MHLRAIKLVSRFRAGKALQNAREEKKENKPYSTSREGPEVVNLGQK